jgi:hypothetical protein
MAAATFAAAIRHVRALAAQSWPTFFRIDKSGKGVWGFDHDPPQGEPN